jgi:hypothetical protein
MRYLELFEAGSRGVYYRTKEASNGKKIVFKNAEGDVLTAVGNALLPEKESFYANDTIATLPPSAKKLPIPEQKKLLKTGQQKVMDALEIYREEAKISPENWNVVNTNGRAALITLWTNSKNELVAYVKLFLQKNAGAIPFFWSNSQFAKETGYGIENKAQERTTLNLKPTTVIGPNAYLYFDVDQLLEQVSTNLATKTDLPPEIITQIPLLLNNVSRGGDPPAMVANAAAYLSSYEIDLGETAAPIALMTGHYVSGAYQQVETQLLKPMGSSWKKIRACSFPTAGNEQLVDSYLKINNKTKLSVSSKDSKGGAAASITSISKIVEENPERFNDLLAESKNGFLFNALKILKEHTAIDGPLYLARLYKIIDTNEARIIKEIINDPHATAKDVSRKSSRLAGPEFLKNPMYNPNKHALNYSVGFHLLAIVARHVTTRLNKQQQLVSSFFKEVLARSNMIQIKTHMKTEGDAAGYVDFQVIWPPIFEGDVKFVCENYYMASSRPGGKISFKIG